MTEGSINYEAHVPWLQGRGLNVYTQFGEDGLIAGCLQRIGETTRQCFEIGASDGGFFSNTLLLRDAGWYAVLIEGNETQAKQLKADFGNSATCIQSMCTNLDSVLLGTTLTMVPDLGVIDVDGQDYWLWNDLVLFRPRIMLVEISTQGTGQPIPSRGEPFPAQAGLKQITDLGQSKGYTLVATTFCNALFVDNACL